MTAEDRRRLAYRQCTQARLVIRRAWEAGAFEHILKFGAQVERVPGEFRVRTCSQICQQVLKRGYELLGGKFPRVSLRWDDKSWPSFLSIQPSHMSDTIKGCLRVVPRLTFSST